MLFFLYVAKAVEKNNFSYILKDSSQCSPMLTCNIWFFLAAPGEPFNLRVNHDITTNFPDKLKKQQQQKTPLLRPTTRPARAPPWTGSSRWRTRSARTGSTSSTLRSGRPTRGYKVFKIFFLIILWGFAILYFKSLRSSFRAARPKTDRSASPSSGRSLTLSTRYFIFFLLWNWGKCSSLYVFFKKNLSFQAEVNFEASDGSEGPVDDVVFVTLDEDECLG